MPDSSLFWAILFLGLTLTTFLLEIFVPSGGMLGIAGIAFLATSLWHAFSVSSAVGWLFLGGYVVMLPVGLALALKIIPKTALGRKILLSPPELGDDPQSHREVGHHLIGQIGRAVTVLRPSGFVDFDGRRVDARSEEGFLAAGALVRAIRIQSGEIVVREVDPELVRKLLNLPESSDSAPSEAESSVAAGDAIPAAPGSNAPEPAPAAPVPAPAVAVDAKPTAAAPPPSPSERTRKLAKSFEEEL